MLQYYIGLSLEQLENFFPSNIQGGCYSFGALRAVRIVTQTELAMVPSLCRPRLRKKEPKKIKAPRKFSPPSPLPRPPTHEPIFLIARSLVTALRIVEPCHGAVVSSNLRTSQIYIATAKTGYPKYFPNLT